MKTLFSATWSGWHTCPTLPPAAVVGNVLWGVCSVGVCRYMPRARPAGVWVTGCAGAQGNQYITVRRQQCNASKCSKKNW